MAVVALITFVATSFVEVYTKLPNLLFSSLAHRLLHTGGVVSSRMPGTSTVLAVYLRPFRLLGELRVLFCSKVWASSGIVAITTTLLAMTNSGVGLPIGIQRRTVHLAFIRPSSSISLITTSTLRKSLHGVLPILSGLLGLLQSLRPHVQRHVLRYFWQDGIQVMQQLILF